MSTPVPRTRERVRVNAPVATTSVSVERAVVDRGERHVTPIKEEVVHQPVKVPAPHPAYVSVGGGATYNTGNFSSVRVDVRIDWPCAPTPEALHETYAFISGEVDGMIQREADAALGQAEAAAGDGE